MSLIDAGTFQFMDIVLSTVNIDTNALSIFLPCFLVFFLIGTRISENLFRGERIVFGRRGKNEGVSVT